MALNLPLDEKLAASINRRRILENQRKKRIFNSKLRQIGIDVNILNQQVHDSLFKRIEEEEKEKLFDEQAIHNDNLVKLFEQQKADELKEVNKKIDEYRQTVQRPEYRRDFDLYDPDLKKKERPLRMAPHDPCPVSGVQKMEGEDLDGKDRLQKQKQQVRDILLQQMEAKRLANCKKEKEMQDWERNLLHQDRHASLLAKEEAENNRKNIENLKKDNKMLSLLNTERRMQQKCQEEMENRKDIEYNFYGPLLSEDPSVGRSSLNPLRVIPDRWKGMSKEQLERIHQQQLQQIEENQMRKQQEQYENSLWNRNLLHQHKIATLLEEDQNKQRFQINKCIELKNQVLQQEQKLCNDFNNKVAFRNVITDDYFSQFNTTSR